ncbi:MAG: hypothetical protein HND53_02065 [Proteobacteria bacterium]|nr:hypothetical protein [Pseudomonadota bacterium]NOG59256.1 hypothetical protein [Pseudomonadota bacterium]
MSETESIEGLIAIVGVAGFAFFGLLVILWIVLPFLIMGTNKRLDRIIQLLKDNANEQKETSKHYEKLISDIDK